MTDCIIRAATMDDRKDAYYVCLKTGNYGDDGEPYYAEDPDALGRVFVGPYLEFEPRFSFVLADSQGVCGYVLGALDSHRFFDRFEKEWRPALCAAFPEPTGDPVTWTRVQQVHYSYHHPDYFCPEPYDVYPSHLHIDLLLRAQGRGYGRRMIEMLMHRFHTEGSPGAHLGVSALNTRAPGFYERLGFRELVRAGTGADECIYMGRRT
jgi:ribosomal protein S18 acetylase RimI-like enzyme